jgi:hypothetical protein
MRRMIKRVVTTITTITWTIRWESAQGDANVISTEEGIQLITRDPQVIQEAAAEPETSVSNESQPFNSSISQGDES